MIINPANAIYFPALQSVFDHAPYCYPNICYSHLVAPDDVIYFQTGIPDGGISVDVYHGLDFSESESLTAIETGTANGYNYAVWKIDFGLYSEKVRVRLGYTRGTTGFRYDSNVFEIASLNDIQQSILVKYKNSKFFSGDALFPPIDYEAAGVEHSIRVPGGIKFDNIETGGREAFKDSAGQWNVGYTGSDTILNLEVYSAPSWVHRILSYAWMHEEITMEGYGSARKLVCIGHQPYSQGRELANNLGLFAGEGRYKLKHHGMATVRL